MRLRGLVAGLLVVLVAGWCLALWLARPAPAPARDTVALNEVTAAVTTGWASLPRTGVQPVDGIDYAVVDTQQQVVATTRPGLTTDLWQARGAGQSVTDVVVGGQVVGYVLFDDATPRQTTAQRWRPALAAGGVVTLAVGLTLVGVAVVERRVLRPFRQMQGFARQVAAGQLDAPLPMDRGNAFGAFTESFDLMRDELARARRAEAKARTANQELVASLAHDIKTPVSSIEAVAEVTALHTGEPRTKDALASIQAKAEQIDSLVTDLFTATLDDLESLTVTVTDLTAGEVATIVRAADFAGAAVIGPAPACVVRADRVRLTQVAANILANAAKYANTPVEVTFALEDDGVAIRFADDGPGAAPDELPRLTEKFFRGAGHAAQPGAGLGLYLADKLLTGMGGSLRLSNRDTGGFLARCWLPLA